MIKIYRENVLAYLTLLFCPLLSALMSIVNLRLNNLKACINILSLTVFFITIRIPPFQDLYRRYVSSYYSYTSTTTLSDALANQIDYLFYLNSWLFFKLGLPFYIIPALYAALSTYMVLSSIYDMWVSENGKHSKTTLIIAFLCVFSFVDFIMIASTLRFGFAVALVIKALSFIYIRKKKLYGLILLLLAITCHIGMLIIIISLIMSKFIKISKISCVIFSALAYFSSAIIVPFLLSNIDLGQINNYVNNGYINSGYANVTNNINTLIVQSYKWLLLLFFLSGFVSFEKRRSAYNNHLMLLIIICSCSAVSVTILNRYFIGLILPLLVIAVQSSLENINKKKLFQLFSILIICINVLFVNIYLERRQIILGKLWYGLITPPVFHLLYDMKKFDSYLKELDEDGNWTKNKIAE